MNEELSHHREGVEEEVAGEGSPEWSERSERNGGEPSPATRPPQVPGFAGIRSRRTAWHGRCFAVARQRSVTEGTWTR